jgi:hypothetical protein
MVLIVTTGAKTAPDVDALLTVLNLAETVKSLL